MHQTLATGNGQVTPLPLSSTSRVHTLAQAMTLPGVARKFHLWTTGIPLTEGSPPALWVATGLVALPLIPGRIRRESTTMVVERGTPSWDIGRGGGHVDTDLLHLRGS